MGIKKFFSTKTTGDTNICSLVNNIIQSLCDCEDCISMETIFDIRVALSELIQNALRHGNKGDKNKYIKVNAGITSDGYAFFVVEDEGEGFDYRDLVRETDDLMQLKESGRGVIIVEGLCDKLKFNEKGNKAVILKKLT